MALTSDQKHYIKKNLETLNLDEIASVLRLPKKVILNYLKSHLPEKKYQKITKGLILDKNSLSIDVSAFDLKQFCQKNIPYFILFFILIFIIYLNSFDNAFVSDDILGTQKNAALHDWSYLRYLASWSFLPHFILAKLGITEPFYFRAINIFYHFGSTCLIFIIFNITTKKNIAFFTALLFAVHPILVESVAWISARPYSQYAFFFLLSFLLYLLSSRSGKNTTRLLGFSGLFFFIALISSEKAIPLFAVFPLYELAFGNLKKKWKKILPFLVASAVFATLFLTTRTQQRFTDLGTQYYGEAEGLYNPLVQIPIAISSYLGLIFWPDGLTLYHSEMSFSFEAYLLQLLIFILFGGLIFYGWKKNRFVFFWLTFFFISLMPTLTPLKVSWIVAERYVYIGTLGILALIAYFFNWILEKFPAKKNWLSVFFAIIILTLSLRTIVRNVDWDNEDNLWIATGKTSPSGNVIHNNLGDVYARQKNYTKAIEEFKKATEINPRYADAYHNMANTYQAMGKIDEAATNYQKALEFNPKLWQSHQNLASIYFNRNDFQKAREEIEKALKINPTDSSLQENWKLIEGKL
jgi:tetratricopeptide (TPR) repeat protein